MVPPTSVRETSFSELDEGAVSEVLSSLSSQASLAVASAVCKPWLSICRSPAFLRRFRRRHPGMLLALFHSSSGLVSDLRVIRIDGACSSPDLTVALRNMDKAVISLKRFHCYLDLQIVDYHGGWFLLKSNKYNHVFAFDLLTGRNFELRWTPQNVFLYDHMAGLEIDGGNIVFAWEHGPFSPGLKRSDQHCHFYSANTGKWQKVLPLCPEADAAMYAERRHNIFWRQRSGEVVYSLCGDSNVGWCLAVLDTRSMSYSVVKVPRCLQMLNVLPRLTVMEMDDPGSICLVDVVVEPRLSVQAWLWRGQVNAAAGEEGWTLYRNVELQELASKLAVQLKYVQVVTAYAGVVHLRLVEEPKHHQLPKSCYFVSLDLSSKEFSNVQPQILSLADKIYPFFLPWRPPFVPLPGDNAEADN